MMMTIRDAIKLLENNGFILLRTNGSHKIYGRDKERFSLPCHKSKGTISKGVIRQIKKIIEDE